MFLLVFPLLCLPPSPPNLLFFDKNAFFLSYLLSIANTPHYICCRVCICWYVLFFYPRPYGVDSNDVCVSVEIVIFFQPTIPTSHITFILAMFVDETTFFCLATLFPPFDCSSKHLRHVYTRGVTN